MSEKDNERKLIDIIKTIYGNFARGDLEAVITHMDPQIEWFEPEGVGHEGTYRGHDELRKMFPENTEWETFRVVPEEFYADGDTVLALGHYGGTHKKTAKDMKASFTHKYKFKGDKVFYFSAIIDTGQVQKAQRS